jgi:uncharacterized protein YkwD
MFRTPLIVALVSCVAVAAADGAVSIDSRAQQKADSRRVANEAIELRVKRLVDRYRTAVGLPPVTLDAKLSKDCTAHAEYMRLNNGTPAMDGLNAHHERPNLPGASTDGAACGEAADLFFDVSDVEVAVDGWMATLYHRRPILTPTLERIGVGYS